MYTDLVLIGRFQPLHNEHLKIIENALTKCAHLVIVLGSAKARISPKNPWTAEAREAMIRASVSNPEAISFVYSDDYPDTVDWETWIIHDTHEAILDNLNGDLPVRLHGLDQCKIGLLCPHKDAETSAYLNLFECWDHIEVPVENAIHATDIRKAIYKLDWEYVQDNVPPSVYETIYWANHDYCRVEYDYIKSYKKLWKNAPFPPMFITVDNVVMCGNKVLLIKRGGQPGLGMWALPGGFHEQGQTLLQSALRELQEETGLVGVYPYGSRVFDNPSRSQLGTMVTHAFFYRAEEEFEVEGADDATHAEWVDISTLDSRYMHDDHYDIIMEAFYG